MQLVGALCYGGMGQLGHFITERRGQLINKELDESRIELERQKFDLEKQKFDFLKQHTLNEQAAIKTIKEITK
uniref:hypothetical protein n=1 Tax=Gloeochaete wittrockiana TaxID=38269 RepID=UPI00051AA5BD|nr:hypothetical protein [Gloeochaete wittrockiana]